MATLLLVLLVAFQGISAQCRGYRGPPATNSWGSPAALSASKGAGVTVASGSTTPPRGVSLSSENAIEGNLAVAGKLPFLGSVGLEGVIPSYGKGVVDYNTGNTNIAIVKEETKTCYGTSFSPSLFPTSPFPSAGVPKSTKTIISDVPLGITLTASGGDLIVSSGSSLSPNGVFVISENTFEGPVSVAGMLPFLGVVSFNDVLPTGGAGIVNYKCCDGPIAINEISCPLPTTKNVNTFQKSSRNYIQ